MKRVFLLIFSLLIFTLTLKAMADTVELIGAEQPLAQGEVVEIRVKGAPGGSEVIGFWRGQPLEFFNIDTDTYGSLLGIDLRLPPGTYPLKVEVNSPGNSPLTKRANVQVIN